VIEISYDVGGRKRLSSKKAKKFGQILLVNSSELLTGIGTSTIVCFIIGSASKLLSTPLSKNSEFESLPGKLIS
jgi:hypothetical protein